MFMTKSFVLLNGVIVSYHGQKTGDIANSCETSVTCDLLSPVNESELWY